MDHFKSITVKWTVVTVRLGNNILHNYIFINTVYL